jgi:hypothetical protein
MRISLILLLLPLLATGCEHPDEKAERVDKTTGSWSTAVRLTAEDFEHAKVPQLYVKQMLDAAQEELPQSHKDLADVPPTQRTGPDARLTLLEARVHAMQEALDMGANDHLIAIATTMPVDAQHTKSEGAARRSRETP